MLESLKRSPLPLEQFPESARKVLEPEAPLPLRMMAAKALLPLAAIDTVCVLYQLSFDPATEVRQCVGETMTGLDLAMIEAIVTEPLSKEILDWLAETRSEDVLLEKLALNQVTADATILNIAKRANQALTEIIAANHIRLLRSPEIIEALYLNPATRMATVDRILTLVKEQKVDLHGLKVLQDALASPDYSGAEEGLDEEAFEQVLVEAHQKSLDEKPDEPPPASTKNPEDGDEEAEEETPERQSRIQLIDKMSAPQRIRLALVGSREDRNILIRDTRRIVYMSVIRSPKVSLSEVGLFASSRSIPDDVISFIASKREWTRYYPIIVSLVNNPKCPFADALTFLRQLRVNDLKALQRSKNIPAQLARQAQAIYRQKSQGK